jgi:hypothetical protein
LNSVSRCCGNPTIRPLLHFLSSGFLMYPFPGNGRLVYHQLLHSSVNLLIGSLSQYTLPMSRTKRLQGRAIVQKNGSASIPGTGHVEFVVGKVVQGAGFLGVLRFSLPTIIARTAPHSNILTSYHPPLYSFVTILTASISY